MNPQEIGYFLFYNVCLRVGWQKFVKASLGSVVILRTLRNCWKQISLPLFLIQILQRKREQKLVLQTLKLKITYCGSS